MFGHLKGLQTNKVDEMGASDDADTSTQLHVQKYPTGSLMLKELDMGKLSRYINGFGTTSGVYSVQQSDQTEEMMAENLIENLIVFSPDSEWIPYKGQNVYVNVGKTMHEARIDSAVPEKQGHVVVRWDINNRSDTVDP